MEIAVRTVRIASADSAAPPRSGPVGPHRSAAATPPAPRRMSTSSTAEVLPSSVPPAAPNATPANAAPSRVVLAARACERDTGQVYAPHRQPRKRYPRKGRHTATEGEQPACGREEPDRDQRQEQRQRHAVGRAGEIEEPVRA